MIHVAVNEGWAGGKWFTQPLRQALAASGYEVTDVLHAEVIIAHSTACYALSNKTPANLYILIDPPYWPRKSIFSRMLAKKHADNKTVRGQQGLKYWLNKNLHELGYICAKPAYTKLALKNHDSLEFLHSLRTKSVYLIRNDQDNFCSPDIQTALAAYPNITYVALPGEHDDYYTNPQPYVDLVSHYFKSQKPAA
jgi:hypothetical protein